MSVASPLLISKWEETAPIGHSCLMISRNGLEEAIIPLHYGGDFLTFATYDEVVGLHRLGYQPYDNLWAIFGQHSLDEEFVLEVDYCSYAVYSWGAQESQLARSISGWRIAANDGMPATVEFLPERHVHRGLASKMEQTDPTSGHGFSWVVPPHESVKAWAEGLNGEGKGLFRA